MDRLISVIGPAPNEMTFQVLLHFLLDERKRSAEILEKTKKYKRISRTSQPKKARVTKLETIKKEAEKSIVERLLESSGESSMEDLAAKIKELKNGE